MLPCKSSAKHTESTDTVSDQGISLRDAMFNAIQDFSIAVKANDVEESDWQRLHALIALVPDDVVTLSLRAALGASHDDAMNYTRAAASEMARGNFNDGEENADAAARAEERFHSLLQLVPDTLVRG